MAQLNEGTVSYSGRGGIELLKEKNDKGRGENNA
jgi:hypothetical protein